MPREVPLPWMTSLYQQPLYQPGGPRMREHVAVGQFLSDMEQVGQSVLLLDLEV
jgi:hypothetical protein